MSWTFYTGLNLAVESQISIVNTIILANPKLPWQFSTGGAMHNYIIHQAQEFLLWQLRKKFVKFNFPPNFFGYTVYIAV